MCSFWNIYAYSFFFIKTAMSIFNLRTLGGYCDHRRLYVCLFVYNGTILHQSSPYYNIILIYTSEIVPIIFLDIQVKTCQIYVGRSSKYCFLVINPKKYVLKGSSFYSYISSYAIRPCASMYIWFQYYLFYPSLLSVSHTSTCISSTYLK